MQILLPSKQEHLTTRPMLLGARNVHPRQLSSDIVISSSLLVFFPSPTSSSHRHPCPYSSNNYTTHCQSSSASLEVPSLPPSSRCEPATKGIFASSSQPATPRGPRYIRKQYKKLRKVTRYQCDVSIIVVCGLVAVFLFGLGATGILK